MLAIPISTFLPNCLQDIPEVTSKTRAKQAACPMTNRDGIAANFPFFLG
jgi:hypothetical protein